MKVFINSLDDYEELFILGNMYELVDKHECFIIGVMGYSLIIN